MITVIAGGRDYTLTDEDREMLAQLPITEVVSGGARGADKGGEEFAAAHGLKLTCFPADWKRHGRFAGPFRNQEMAEYADAVVLFPGGKGTANMHKQASKHGCIIYDWRGAP